MLELVELEIKENNLESFKDDMRAAFRYGAAEGIGMDEEVLPDEDIERSLQAKGAKVYAAVDNEEVVGGAIITVDEDTHVNHLDFLYVKVGCQGKKIGQFIWREIERIHSETKIWETCTPYFDKRNIHFYINSCGFHAIEFFHKYHPDPHFPEDAEDEYFEGMFRFQKVM